jgi:predicted dienelactone hydrolase
MVSDHLRPELPLDAGPALDVADKRVKAVFVMRPASFRAFGMDEAGLRQPALPAYIMVGAADTQRLVTRPSAIGWRRSRRRSERS